MFVIVFRRNIRIHTHIKVVVDSSWIRKTQIFVVPIGLAIRIQNLIVWCGGCV